MTMQQFIQREKNAVLHPSRFTLWMLTDYPIYLILFLCFLHIILAGGQLH